MLTQFAEEEETFLGYKSRIFESLKILIFSKGLTHSFGPKNANFFFICFWSKQD